MNNRVTVNAYDYEDPDPGRYGINTGKYTDWEIHDNIIRGFDTGIRIAADSCTAANNHPYAYPVNKGEVSYGVLIEDSMRDGTRVEANWIDNVSVPGIEDRCGNRNIHQNNWIWLRAIDLSDDVYGIHFPNGSKQCIAKGNLVWIHNENATKRV
jgi:hypothetical protein